AHEAAPLPDQVQGRRRIAAMEVWRPANWPECTAEPDRQQRKCAHGPRHLLCGQGAPSNARLRARVPCLRWLDSGMELLTITFLVSNPPHESPAVKPFGIAILCVVLLGNPVAAQRGGGFAPGGGGRPAPGGGNPAPARPNPGGNFNPG